jgi:hypothetical protein
MRAEIVRKLEQEYFNPSVSSIKGFLKKNSFTGNSKVCAWLEELFKLKILKGNICIPFENTLTDEIKNCLKQGDDFYFNLFRANGFITEHTSPKESSQPLTNAANYIYNSLFREAKLNHESLLIYTELRHLLEKELGKKIAFDSKLQVYENWKLISEELEVEHKIYNAWLKNIQPESINKEKINFALIPSSAKLSELSNLRGYGRNAEEEANNYISHIKKYKSASVVEYIHEAARSSDLLEFKGSIVLQQELLHRTGLIDWLLFTDSLKYPNLQDHNFLFITSIDDYPVIINYILCNNSFTTPKEHLLIIALENYYDFADRTVSGIHQLFFGRDNDEKKEVIANAKIQYNSWLNDIIPSSFTAILNIVFPSNKLHESANFTTFFEWINSHNTLHFTHPAAAPKVKLIETLNDLFQKRLDSNEEDRHQLIDALKPKQINYEALKKMVLILDKNKTDLLFRDKLSETYIAFITGKDFSWFATGNVDFAAAINNAYYFSQLINCFEDAFMKWKSLLMQCKTVHEGWLKNQADVKIYYREAFLFCTGIGMAYNLYSNKDALAGKKTLFSILELLITQIRNSGDMSSIDYTTPIQFAAITIGNFDAGGAEPFLKIVLEKTDKIKYLLIALNDLLEYNKSLTLSAASKSAITQKINDEFWVIEHQKTGVVMKDKLNYYIELKRKALEVCL